MTGPKHQDPQNHPVWICLGKITKPFGIRGGVRIHLHNAESKALRPGLELELRAPDTTKNLRSVIKSEHGAGRVVFREFNDRNQVEELRQFEVWIRREDLPPLRADETYLVDFLGAEVISDQNGYLGEITKMDIRTPQPLATVKTADGRLVDMPFVAGLIVELSEEEKKVWIDEPEGLFSGSVDLVPETENKKS
jgi:16S rRNA processing protein RimM